MDMNSSVPPDMCREIVKNEFSIAGVSVSSGGSTNTFHCQFTEVCGKFGISSLSQLDKALSKQQKTQAINVKLTRAAFKLRAKNEEVTRVWNRCRAFGQKAIATLDKVKADKAELEKKLEDSQNEVSELHRETMRAQYSEQIHKNQNEELKAKVAELQAQLIDAMQKLEVANEQGIQRESA